MQELLKKHGDKSIIIFGSREEADALISKRCMSICERSNNMITFEQIGKLFATDTQGALCIEILFSVKGSEKLDRCMMGIFRYKEESKAVYWLGLTKDGKNAFDYSTFEELSSAKVFDGKSLYEIWDTVTVEEIDGCEPMERLLAYIGENK